MSNAHLLQVFFVRLLPLLVMALVGARAMAQADPPSRVARVNHAEGPVVFSQAGDNEWIDAVLNRPLSRGDRVWTDKGSRAELQVGSSAVRLNGLTQLEILALDDQAAQLSVTQGSVHVRVRSLPEGENFEIDTPNLAYRAAYPGEYRIDVDGARGTTRVTVLSGTGAVYGEAGQVLPLGAGQQITFRDRGLTQVAVQESPPQDNFDRWAADRSRREDQSVSARYVPREVVGYQQLDAHGQWTQDATYGAVWFPQGTPANWAPYRNGHWEWMSPWGWTWIDDAPWGFAPFHYGRWAMIGSRWAWAPGRLGLKPVYAPALVAFVGTGNSASWNIPLVTGRPAVAWFPLAPGEVWQPGYRASPVYMSNLNQNLVLQANPTYANQRKVEALTSISAEDFHRGKPARAGWLRIASNTLTSAQVVPPPPMPERGGLTENQRTAAAMKALADAAAARQAEAAQREAARRQAEAQAQEAARAQQAQAQVAAKAQEAARAQAAARAQTEAQAEAQAARASRAQQVPREQQPPREAKAETPLLAKWLQRLGIMTTSTAKPAAALPPSAAPAPVARATAPAKAAVKAKALSPTTAAPEAAPRAEQAKVEEARAEEQARREKLARRAEQAKREQIAKRAELAKRELLAARQAELAKREQLAAKQAEQARREQVAKQAAEQARREQARREAVARQAEQARRDQLAKRAEQLRREQVAKQAEQARRDAVARREEQQRKELHAQHVEQARRAADRDAQALREQRVQREELQARRDAQERELAQQREQAQRAAWARQQQALAEQWRRDHQAWEQQQQQQQYRARGGRPDLRDDRRSRGIPIINAGPVS